MTENDLVMEKRGPQIKNEGLRNDPWLIPVIEHSDSVLKMFCVPFAGGNASAFDYWRSINVSRISIFGIELPSRQKRASEAPYVNMNGLVEDLSRFLVPHIDREFVLFGNCTGSVIAFEVAHRLRELIGREPLCLIPSNGRAPHIPRPETPVHGLSEEDLVIALGKMGATPPEVLANKKMLQFVLPTLRADFAVAEKYVYKKKGPLLGCNIRAIAGESDPVVAEIDIDAWERHTSGEFSKLVITGNHNLLADKTPQLLASVEALLQRLIEEK
jgi:medium-chain acyl-[acyl-carrier-protein] hydrolase